MWPMFISFAALEKDFNQWDPLIDGKDDNLIQGTNVTVLQSSIWMVSSGYIATNGCTESPPSTVLKMGGKRPATSTLTPFTRPVWASPHVVRVKGQDKVWCYLHGTIHVCQHHYWTVSTVFNHTQFFFQGRNVFDVYLSVYVHKRLCAYAVRTYYIDLDCRCTGLALVRLFWSLAFPP